MINGFLPSLEDSFEIITATGGVNGTFSTLAEELPALASGLEWAINYGANNVMLSVVSVELAGDYNDDGVVSAADYVVWRNNEGQSVTLPNDATPGTVTEEDYEVWVANFGNTIGDGSRFEASIPEPTAWLLTLLATSIYLRRNRPVRVVSGLVDK